MCRWTTPSPIYLINLLWKLELGLGLDLKLHYFSIIHGKKKTSTLSSANFPESNIVLKSVYPFDQQQNKIILGVPIN